MVKRRFLKYVLPLFIILHEVLKVLKYLSFLIIFALTQGIFKLQEFVQPKYKSCKTLLDMLPKVCVTNVPFIIDLRNNISVP